MKVLEELLKIMESGESENISGQELSERLGVSRAAVWKAVDKLRAQGYQIEAAPNRGYKLIKSGDMLSKQQIEALLPEKLREKTEILLFKTINSTNTYGKKLAADGAKSGTVIIADQQTEGRGRRGHSFYSPPKTGLYMSVILRPQGFAADIDMVTVCAGCAVCRAVENLTDRKPMIKWVNDIFIDDKKICGILSEGVTDFEAGSVDSIVVGIGVNVTTDIFPQEIENKAGALNCQIPRSKIAAEIIKQLFECLNSTREKNIAEYKSRSLVLGKEISYFRNNFPRQGRAVDIDQKGQLIVETEDGRETLNAGEISVKL